MPRTLSPHWNHNCKTLEQNRAGRDLGGLLVQPPAQAGEPTSLSFFFHLDLKTRHLLPPRPHPGSSPKESSPSSPSSPLQHYCWAGLGWPGACKNHLVGYKKPLVIEGQRELRLGSTMGPSGLQLFLFLFFLFFSMGCALYPISLPMGTIKIPIGVAPVSSLHPDLCSLPPVSGLCPGLHERWHYSPELRLCLRFTYGGCRGNLNNFMTQESCERTCSPSPTVKPDACPPPAALPDEACQPFCSSDESCPGAQRCCRTGCGRQCQWPVGAIRGYCPRRSPSGLRPLLCLTSCRRDSDCALHFPGRKCCRNGCLESCVAPMEEHPGVCPRMPVLQTLVPCNHTCIDDRQCLPEEKCCFDGCGRVCLTPERPSRCQLPPEPGPCQELHPRYYYSSRLGHCRFFFYSGCPGNANNFRSRAECERACGRSRPDPLFD